MAKTVKLVATDIAKLLQQVQLQSMHRAFMRGRPSPTETRTCTALTAICDPRFHTTPQPPLYTIAIHSITMYRS
ncbi:hypothetical protein J6590_100822 [Homalodisca vitripennis]|nr:hypothetical protein J6590_100822 [Homalodisca vitripennis]